MDRDGSTKLSENKKFMEWTPGCEREKQTDKEKSFWLGKVLTICNLRKSSSS